MQFCYSGIALMQILEPGTWNLTPGHLESADLTPGTWTLEPDTWNLAPTF